MARSDFPRERFPESGFSFWVRENGIEEISLPIGFLTAADGEEMLLTEKGNAFERERLWVWRWRPRIERRRDIAA